MPINALPPSLICHTGRATIHTSGAKKESSVASEAYFLEEQLAALVELRGEGHFSDIIGFARIASRKASKLLSRTTGPKEARLHKLVCEYRKLGVSLAH